MYIHRLLVHFAERVAELEKDMQARATWRPLVQNLEKELEAAQAEAEGGDIAHLRRVVASQGRTIADLESKLKLSGPHRENDANLEALLRNRLVSQEQQIAHLKATLDAVGEATVAQNGLVDSDTDFRDRIASQEQQIAHLGAALTAAQEAAAVAHLHATLDAVGEVTVAQNAFADSENNFRDRVTSQEQQNAHLRAALAAAEEAAAEWQAMHTEVKQVVLDGQSKERDLIMQLKRCEDELNKSHAAARRQEAHGVAQANELEVLKQLLNDAQRSSTELQTESAEVDLLKQELEERKLALEAAHAELQSESAEAQLLRQELEKREAAWVAAQAEADLGTSLSEAAWEAAQSEAADLRQSLSEAKRSENEIKESLAERELQLQEALSAGSELTQELEIMQGAWADAKTEVGTLKQSLATEGERFALEKERFEVLQAQVCEFETLQNESSTHRCAMANGRTHEIKDINRHTN